MSPQQRVNGWRWTAFAAVAGFLSPFLFSNLLQLSRALFVGAHSIVVAVIVWIFVSRHRFDAMAQVRRRWAAGVVVGVVAGALLIRQVVTQPASPRPDGAALASALVWYGVIYGTADAVLLTVLPVLALYGMRDADVLARPGSRMKYAGIALLGSAIVTAAYHLGFAEYRGAELRFPIIGNAVMTLAYLVSGNPLAAIVSHILMHIAAVMHGMASTSQLPPHY